MYCLGHQCLKKISSDCACKRTFHKILGMVNISYYPIAADKRSLFIYYGKNRNKRENNYSVNLLGKIKGKEKYNIHARCTAKQ